MAKRLFDILFSVTALFLTVPLVVFAVAGIKLTSPGPVFYRARRMGWKGKPFVMHKFRTMHLDQGNMKSAITGINDPRIFPFGSLLRKLKIDELPQFYDVIRGRMSIVGPRPECPDIVLKHYTEKQWRTLAVRPGMVSPGSIYNYTHSELFLASQDAEQSYVEFFMDRKLSLELVYVSNASFLYDLRLIFRTIWVMICIAFGRRRFPNPPEMKQVLEIMKMQAMSIDDSSKSHVNREKHGDAGMKVNI